MTPQTRAAIYTAARAEVRCAKALAEYRHWRRLWSLSYDRGALTPIFVRAVAARAEWATLEGLAA